jgi:hypothetical protein
MELGGRSVVVAMYLKFPHLLCALAGRRLAGDYGARSCGSFGLIKWMARFKVGQLRDACVDCHARLQLSRLPERWQI